MPRFNALQSFLETTMYMNATDHAHEKKMIPFMKYIDIYACSLILSHFSNYSIFIYVDFIDLTGRGVNVSK